MMKNFVIGMGVLLAAATAANAQVWNEVGDAGELAASAQVVAGSGPLTTILGSLSDSDVDMYQIRIDDPSLFIAQHTNVFNFDSQMWLFNMDGTGVAFNDDTTGLRSQISNPAVAAGNYLLAISGYDRDAVDSNGAALWLDTPFNNQRAPDGPGAANPVAGWQGTGGNRGDYEIAIRGASFVPAPGALALAGVGGALIGRRRRK
jgi:hypothetical protein